MNSVGSNEDSVIKCLLLLKEDELDCELLVYYSVNRMNTSQRIQF